MRMLRNLGVVSSIAIASAATAQDAVQWRVEDGGNGHWYACVRSMNGLHYGQASVQAAELGGHLFTGCGSEFDSAIQLTGALDPENWIQSSDGQWLGPWIGLVLNGESWDWIDGTSCQFDRWDEGFSQPDSPELCCESRTILYCIGPFPVAVTHDVTVDRISGSVLIEWSADCNADGIVDLGQILAGELDDANGNNIPDCCEADVPCNCPADLDSSGAVNGVDLAIILNTWGTNGGKYPQADIDGDGVVGGADLALVLGAWGECQ